MFAELADADSPAAHAVVSVADRMGGGCRGPTVLRHHQPQVLVAFCGWYRTYSITPCRHTLSKSTLGQPACTMSANSTQFNNCRINKAVSTGQQWRVSMGMHACDERSINTNFSLRTASHFFAERSKARTTKMLPCDRSPQQPLQRIPTRSARQRPPRIHLFFNFPTPHHAASPHARGRDCMPPGA